MSFYTVSGPRVPKRKDVALSVNLSSWMREQGYWARTCNCEGIERSFQFGSNKHIIFRSDDNKEPRTHLVNHKAEMYIIKELAIPVCSSIKFELNDKANLVTLARNIHALFGKLNMKEVNPYDAVDDKSAAYIYVHYGDKNSYINVVVEIAKLLKIPVVNITGMDLKDAKAAIRKAMQTRHEIYRVPTLKKDTGA